MNAKVFLQKTAFFVTGIFVSLISVYLIGYTTAIAMPTSFLTFFGSFSIFVWDLFVVNFLGIGIIAFLFAFVVFRTLKQPKIVHGLVSALGILFGAYVVVPLLFGIPLYYSFIRSWWGYGFELCVLLAFVSAWFLSGRRA